MGAVAGIYMRANGRPDRNVLRRLADRLKRAGPDGEFQHVAGPLALLHRPFYTDADSRRSAAPFVTGDGFVVLWDGRLDNASGLRETLRVTVPSAPATVLAAYRAWGIAALERLLGDFTVALWDPRVRTLVICSDALGRCPLYYHLTDRSCIWSSSSRALAHALGMPLVPNENYVADYLANRPSISAPIEGVEYLRGGHVLQVTPSATSVRRYWSVAPAREIVYRSDAEYEAHFNDLFRRVVADRLKADGPIFCELSGGIDSSTIACVADRLCRETRGLTPAVRTVSYVFNRSPTADERPYISLVEEHLGRRGLHLSEDDCQVLALPDAGIEPDTPTNQLCYLARQDHLAELMEQQGARVMLSGIGGDQMFLSEVGPEGLPPADLVAERRIRDAISSAHEWSRQLQWPLLKTLWLGGCWPLVPTRLRVRWQSTNRLSEWLDPGFVQRTHVRDRLLGMTDDVGFRRPSQKFQYGLVRQTMRPFALERYLSRSCIDVRYPYLDRRIVEFALALPLDQKVRPGETRSLVRRAFRGVLPEGVRERRTKAGPTEAFYRALVRQWPVWSAWLADPRVCAYGFVSRSGFPDALKRARHGVVTNCAQLTRVVSLEIWLRSLEGHDAQLARSYAAAAAPHHATRPSLLPAI